MKKSVFLFVLSLFVISVFAQKRPFDAYFVEEQGYFINANPVLDGYVFTDNYSNTLYYLHDGQLKKLLSAPGCGRYYSVSKDGKQIGLKYISKTGQRPAIINLETETLQYLHDEVPLCGQVGFTKDAIYYTIGTDLIIDKGDAKSRKINLPNYSNIVKISDNYDLLVYSTPNDELILMHLADGSEKQISDTGKMSVYPRFSPDSKKILYQSDGIYVYDMEYDKLYSLGSGLSPKWAPDSEHIIFSKQESTGYTLTAADLYRCSYLDRAHEQITVTADILEQHAIYSSENELLYTDYVENALYKLNLETQSKTLIYQHNNQIEIEFFELSTTKSEQLIPGTVPYTHQVYDTPDAHYGYGSCAPTCAIMAISYYNRLPKWPTPITKLYPHNSDYGAYVSVRYRLNEYYFEENSTTSGDDVAYGGYGYMWGLGSPNSQMLNYLELHYMESSQLWSSSVTWESVVSEIDADFPLSMCAMLSDAGHLILTKGYIENQHTLIFSEPYGDKNTPSWPSYDGQKVYYDWPGYNNGYQNLDHSGAYGVIAWTITGHTSEPEYDHLIIDNDHYNHGFEMNNSEDGSTQRYFRDVNDGYNNHAWYTITMADDSDICRVKWIPTPEQVGNYEIFAYIPASNADAEGAPYKIFDANGEHIVIINQNEYSDEWVSLGMFEYQIGADFYTYLGDSTGIDGQSIVYDAVKYDYIPEPIASFELESQDFCVGEAIVFSNTSENADAYDWAFPGANIESSSDVSPQISYDSPGVYSVSLTAHGSLESDLIVYDDFITIHDVPTAYFAVNDFELFLPEALAVFDNASLNAESCFWSFGDGNSSDAVNPYHYYAEEGNYQVSLIASNPWCEDSFYEIGSEITVFGPTTISNIENLDFTLYPNPVHDVLKLTIIVPFKQIQVFNTRGELVYSEEEITQEINVSDFSAGLYFVLIETEDDVIKSQFVKLGKQ
ncbi:MAG: PKD domain-containing protein [Bacteroidota bacterium]|nr:PKD domain-containing protein [Bacteroidota bacterium]